MQDWKKISNVRICWLQTVSHRQPITAARSFWRGSSRFGIRRVLIWRERRDKLNVGPNISLESTVWITLVVLCCRCETLCFTSPKSGNQFSLHYSCNAGYRFFEIPIEDNWQILESRSFLSHPDRRDASTWFRGPSPPSSTCGWPISSCPWWTSIGRWWAGWCRGGEPTRPAQDTPLVKY